MKNTTKIMLLRLPQNIDDVYDHPAGILHPYSLAFLSGYLKDKGLDVQLFDAAIYHMGKDEIIKRVMEFNPQILGLSIMTQHLPQTVSFIKALKKQYPVITIVGGPHVTVVREDILNNHPEIDIAVIGEGEETLYEIADSIENKKSLRHVKGIIFREDNTLHRTLARELNHDLDSLPFADWESLPMDKYSEVLTVIKNYGGVIASRGCPHACTFCGAKSVLGRKVRRRTPENIVSELKHLYDNHNVRQFCFHDSTFNIDHSWVRDICNKLIATKLNMLWACNLRTENLDQKTLRLMKESGCIRAFVGVESASNEVLRRMKKGTTIERIEAGINLIQQSGIPVDVGFILGMPGETVGSMKKSIAFAKRIKGTSTFSLASPFPGTELYEIAKNEGFKVNDWSQHDLYSLAYVTKGLTKEELEKYYKLAIKSTYLNFKFIFNRLSQLKSWLNLKLTILAACRIFLRRIHSFNK